MDVKGHRDFRTRPEEARNLASRRKGEHAWVLAHPGPASYGKDPGPPVGGRAHPRSGHRRTAGRPRDGHRHPRLPGQLPGPVRVIRNEAEFERLRAGDVLVCPVTSPVWSVLFPSVGALVTDTGGTLSHPAIIAREYGVPAVVATGNGTSALHDGQVVTVDGTAGTVGTIS